MTLLKPPNSRFTVGTWLNDLGLIGRGCEVGVCSGFFAHDIMHQWRGEKLYLVDGWRKYDWYLYPDAVNSDRETQWQRMKQCFDRMYRFEGRVVMIRENSPDAAWLFPDSSLDFCYIDSNHAYDAVKRDIEAFAPKVRSGGVLAGHDYFNGKRPDTNGEEYICGCKRAVDEWAEYNDYVVAVSDMEDSPHEPSWYIQIR